MSRLVIQEVVNDGNVFHLLDTVRDVCKEENQPELAREIQNKVLTLARNFSEALEIVKEFVEVKNVKKK